MTEKFSTLNKQMPGKFPGVFFDIFRCNPPRLYVVFSEILPQSILTYLRKPPAFSAITGIPVGLLIIF